MVTINETKNSKIKGDARYILVEMSGLSTDDKPTMFDEDIDSYVDNGSTFIEIDTGKIFFYDLENEQWKEV